MNPALGLKKDRIWKYGDRPSSSLDIDIFGSITKTGEVICWGSDDYGQASPPASVDGTTGTAIALSPGAGSSHNCAIQAGTAAVICWGRDDSGEASPPPEVNGTTGTATAVAVGGSGSIAIEVPEPDGIAFALAVLTLVALRRNRGLAKGETSSTVSL